jgi:predicted permease
MAPTFLASLRAVGTASTMAFVGFYMHRRGFVTPSGKKMMALLAQQVTIPAFLFAKIIHCPDSDGNGHDDSTICPSVADRISDLQLLLVWPAYVVLCGLVIGYFAARLSNTPEVQTKSCLAACAFGNSTGLVITLLTVVHKQFKGSGAELGRIDPTSFLSVYLLLYPVLQWGVGGWLLAPEEKKDEKHVAENTDMDSTVRISNMDNMESGEVNGEGRLLVLNELLTGTNILSTQTDYSTPPRRHIRSKSFTIDHILNNEPERSYSAALAAVEAEFGVMSPLKTMVVTRNKDKSSTNALKMMVKELSFTSFDHFDQNGEAPSQTASTYTSPITYQQQDDDPQLMEGGPSSTSLSSLRNVSPPTINEHAPLLNSTVSQELQESDIMPLTTTLLRISRKVFQPPVIASITGLVIASFPSVRGLLVNIWGSNGKTAPLQWMFDGIYSVGQAAVPINMVSCLVLLRSVSNST